MRALLPLSLLFLVGCGGAGGGTVVTPPAPTGIQNGTYNLSVTPHATFGVISGTLTVTDTTYRIICQKGEVTQSRTAESGTLRINGVDEPCILNIGINDGQIYGNVSRNGYEYDWTRVYSNYFVFRSQ